MNDSTKQSAVFKLNRYAFMFVVAPAWLGLIFILPLWIGLDNPWGGASHLLLALLGIAHLGLAVWDTLKNHTEGDLFYFPQTARWAEVLHQVLFWGMLVNLFLRAFAVIPQSYYLPLDVIWWVYTNSISLYFRIKRQLGR